MAPAAVPAARPALAPVARRHGVAARAAPAAQAVRTAPTVLMDR
jgi:hypothetical protein